MKNSDILRINGKKLRLRLRCHHCRVVSCDLVNCLLLILKQKVLFSRFIISRLHKLFFKESPIV